MGETNGSHSRIVNEGTANARSLCKSRQNGGKGVGLGQESN